MHCRCVHCGNDSTGGRPGEDGGQFGSSNPSLILFDVLALHATHWGHLLKIRRRGNEVSIEAGLRGPRMGARASAPVRQRAWCMPIVRPELPHAYHVNARHVRGRATSTRYVVEFVTPKLNASVVQSRQRVHILTFGNKPDQDHVNVYRRPIHPREEP